MSELDDNQKWNKIKRCQARIAIERYLKNKPRMWKQLDKIQKQERQVILSDDELSPESRSRRKKGRGKEEKPDKRQFKLTQVSEYEQALKRHRSQQRRFYHPQHEQILHMNVIRIIKELQQAKDQDIGIPFALKSVGIKSLKTLYYGGAKKQFQIVIDFLKTGVIPEWMFQSHRQLLKKNPKQFRGTVKGLIRHQ